MIYQLLVVPGGHQVGMRAGIVAPAKEQPKLVLALQGDRCSPVPRIPGHSWLHQVGMPEVVPGDGVEVATPALVQVMPSWWAWNLILNPQGSMPMQKPG